MDEVIEAYQNLSDNECLPIQQKELDRMDKTLRETGFCIIAGYHGSGKSSLARRYSYYRQPLRRVYCKKVSPQEIVVELEKDTQPLFLDSVTHLLYDERTFALVKTKAQQLPVILGIHLEPQNKDLLFSEYPENLVVVGSLNYIDAKLLAGCPLNENNLDKLLEYSGRRRRDLINLCIEAYTIRGDFSTESIEEGVRSLAEKSQRVYQHLFEEHFTEQHREIVRRIIAGESPDDAEILVRTGMVKEERGELTLNGKLLELIFRKVLS